MQRVRISFGCLCTMDTIACWNKCGADAELLAHVTVDVATRAVFRRRLDMFKSRLFSILLAISFSYR